MAICALVSVSCSKEAVTSIRIVDERVIDGVLYLQTGATAMLAIETTPAGKESVLIYTSSNDNVVTAIEGFVTAHNPGYATLTISSVNGRKVTLEVCVQKRDITSWSSSTGALEVAPGFTNTFTVTVKSAPGMDDDNKQCFTAGNLEYTIENDPKGYFYTTVNENTVTVGCSSEAPKDGSYVSSLKITNISGTSHLNVKLTAIYRAVTGVSVYPTSISELFVGSKTTLTATVLPSNATAKDIEWYVTDTDALSLEPDGDKCVVTGLKAAKAMVIIKSKSDPSKQCNCVVTVVEPYVKSITAYVKQTVFVLGYSADRAFSVKVDPSDFPYTITSDNTSIAEMDGNDIKFKSAGMANFTIKAGTETIKKSILVIDNNYTLTPHSYININPYSDPEAIQYGRVKVTTASQPYLPGQNSQVVVGVNGYTCDSFDWYEIAAAYGSTANNFLTGSFSGDFTYIDKSENNFYFKTAIAMSRTGTFSVKTTTGKTATLNVKAQFKTFFIKSTTLATVATNIGGTWTVSKSQVGASGSSGWRYTVYINSTGYYSDDFSYTEPLQYLPATLKCDNSNLSVSGSSGDVTILGTTPNGTYKLYLEECPDCYFYIQVNS